jgi:hypothetical protein
MLKEKEIKKKQSEYIKYFNSILFEKTKKEKECTKFFIKNKLIKEEYESGTRKIFNPDKIDSLHRIGGPAYMGGEQSDIKLFSWWRFGKRHRLNAPAVFYKDGIVEYWHFNKEIIK